jgi:hypothetical protein
MDSHLTLKEHNNQYLQKASSAEANLRTLIKKHGTVPESVRDVQIARVQVVAPYGSELW